jgi:hypothetical protein
MLSLKEIGSVIVKTNLAIGWTLIQ